jgi:transposase
LIPRFFRTAFPGFEVLDVKEWLNDGRIELRLKARDTKGFFCHRCGHALAAQRGRYPVKLEGMPILGLKLEIHFMRAKGYCARCNKARSERINFIAPESPHLTQDYSWWIGRLTEIAPVTRVAELLGLEAMTVWRQDFARLKRLVQHYKIPNCTHIAVDEVYARSKEKFKGEARTERFFTVITDLKTRKVIWVAESCAKKGLDQFFTLIGPEACSKIQAIAMDQHADYFASAAEHCSNAIVVFDRFHIVQNFEEAVNDTRKELFEILKRDDSTIAELARGQNRFVFLEKASRRSKQDQSLIEEVGRRNKKFLYLELIKERFIDMFNQPSAEAARAVFEEVGDWIWQMGLKPLIDWHRRLDKNWIYVHNYFYTRITTGLSEAFNNVIKTIKKRAYGFRNMEYFRLKIMQVAGYLNSRFISLNDSHYMH